MVYNDLLVTNSPSEYRLGWSKIITYTDTIDSKTPKLVGCFCNILFKNDHYTWRRRKKQ